MIVEGWSIPGMIVSSFFMPDQMYLRIFEGIASEISEGQQSLSDGSKS